MRRHGAARDHSEPTVGDGGRVILGRPTGRRTVSGGVPRGYSGDRFSCLWTLGGKPTVQGSSGSETPREGSTRHQNYRGID